MRHGIAPRRMAGVALTLLLVGFIALALTPQSAEATHFRYGHITWAPTANANEVQFVVTAAFRNGYGVNAVGQYFTEVIGGTGLQFGDGGSTTSADWHVIGFSGLCGEPGLQDVVIARLDPGQTGADVVLHTYAPGGPYVAEINSCCRILSPEHINNPTDGYRVCVDVQLTGGNASPVSGMPPVVAFGKNQVNNFLVPASDPNSDALSFRLSTTAESEPLGTFVQPGPPDAPNALSIDPFSGIITWNTTGATENGGGNTIYSCGIVIEDGSGRVGLDFLICLVDSLGCNDPPRFGYPPTPQNGSLIQGCADDTISFTVQASDPDGGDVVTISNLGLPPGATVSCGTPGNPSSCTFTWATNLGNVGNYVVQFQASDGCNLPVTTSVNIQIDDCTTATEEASWGSVKEMFR